MLQIPCNMRARVPWNISFDANICKYIFFLMIRRIIFLMQIIFFLDTSPLFTAILRPTFFQFERKLGYGSCMFLTISDRSHFEWSKRPKSPGLTQVLYLRSWELNGADFFCANCSRVVLVFISHTRDLKEQGSSTKSLLYHTVPLFCVMSSPCANFGVDLYIYKLNHDSHWCSSEGDSSEDELLEDGPRL